MTLRQPAERHAMPRHATPLPQMLEEMVALEANVARHLASMGFAS